MTTPNTSETETNRTFIARATRLVVIVDHTRWQAAALCTMAALRDVDTLITDDGLGPEVRHVLSGVIGELRIASRGGP
ncbi:MAG: hypothetical protein WCD11_22220 [Solirubrobacteraceae bacterium]